MTSSGALENLTKWCDYGDIVPKNERLLQGRIELRDFCMVVQSVDPRALALEIGVYYGGTHYLWTQFFDRVVSVDQSQKYCDGTMRRLKGFGCDLSKSCIVSGNSHDPSIIEHVKKVTGQPLDFLFIDGDHTAEGLKQDFVNFVPLVRPGGLIAIHDSGDQYGPYKAPAGPTEFFEAVHNCIMSDLNSNTHEYGISYFRFVHSDHTGIAWCVKEKA